MAFWHLTGSIQDNGLDIPDTLEPSPVYNDNEACIPWSHNMTTKQIWQMEMCENSVCEWVQDLSLRVLHIKGKINPADIFTKEMPNGAHFCCLQDFFMCQLSDFLQQTYLDIHLSQQQDEPILHQVMPSAASTASGVMRGHYLSALCSLSLCNTLTAISHLSSAGRQIMQCSLQIVPSIIWGVILLSFLFPLAALFFSHSPLDVLNHPRLIFPAPFPWTQG